MLALIEQETTLRVVSHRFVVVSVYVEHMLAFREEECKLHQTLTAIMQVCLQAVGFSDAAGHIALALKMGV